MTEANEAYGLLAARIDDLVDTADRGILAFSSFLTPGEAAYCKSTAVARRLGDRVFLFGGYDGAERCRLYIIPDYLSDVDGSAEERARLYLADALESSVKAVHISGSGYRALTHRDYLGSLMSLGIERHSIGDIVTTGEYVAVVFGSEVICNFIVESLERVASDKVSAKHFDVPSGFEAQRKRIPISDTVASDRLDCVVGALAGISREKAQLAVRSGACEVDHIPEERCDRRIEPPCVISIRGFGKFDVSSFDGTTKKGRLRLTAEKYV